MLETFTSDAFKDSWENLTPATQEAGASSLSVFLRKLLNPHHLSQRRQRGKWPRLSGPGGGAYSSDAVVHPFVQTFVELKITN